MKDVKTFTIDEILTRLHAVSRPEEVAGMARFGLANTKNMGVSVPNLRAL